MQTKLKQLFTNDIFFCVSVFCGAIGNLLSPIVHSLPGSSDVTSFSYFMQCVLEAICLLFLFFSYRKHSKNVTKGMMGALLTVNLLTAINLVDLLKTDLTNTIIEAVFLTLSIVLFGNHFIINSVHHSMSKNIYINQIASILLMLIPGLFWGVLSAIANPNFTSVLTQIVEVCGFAGMVAAIVCVESRLDAYRLDREADGWTDDKA